MRKIWRGAQGHRGGGGGWRGNGRRALLILPLLTLACTLLGGWTGAALAHAAPAPAGAARPPVAGDPATLTQTAPPQAVGDILPPTAPLLGAQEAYLMDPHTDAVYLSLNADRSVPMASTTKIMTALVALAFSTPNQRIVVGQDAVAMENGIDSVAGLQLGDTLTLRELLYCLMLPSGDDAAVAIADGVAGSSARFVGLMNLEAALMGLTHTHYANVHGLDDPNHAHYTSAGDLAQLAAVAMNNPIFRQIVATWQTTLPANADHHAYPLQNTNLLLAPSAYSGILGIKTGYTGGAGACLVFMAARPYGTLLGVVLGEPNETARFTDAAALMDWGFAIQQKLSGLVQAGA